MTDYDRWKTSPPDEDFPQHCTCCEDHQQRVNDLEELIDWIASHRFYWPVVAEGQPVRVALMPYSGCEAMAEGRTRLEALEKLWREHE